MNRNYIKLLIVVTTILVSFFTFLSTRYEYSTVSSITVFLSFIFALPIFMHYKYKSIKNNSIKIPYLSTMIILYIVSIVIVLLLILDIFYPSIYLIDENNTRIPYDIFLMFNTFKTIFSNIMFMTTSWLMLLFNFIDLDKIETKTNYILTIFVCLVILVIHVNFCTNPRLSGIVNESIVGEKAFYITQNYVYFGFMYFIILVNKMRQNNN